MFAIINKRDSIPVELTPEGRLLAPRPVNGTPTQNLLFKLLEKRYQDLPAMQPGFYELKFTKIGFRHLDMDLTRIED